MRSFKYIAFLVAFLTATSCTDTEIIENRPINSNDMIQVIARVKPFDDRDVGSRSVKVGDETNIASLSLAIFDVNGKCINFPEPNNNTVFEVPKEGLEGKDLYIFANVDLSELKVEEKLDNENPDDDPSLEDFLTYTIDVLGIDIPKIGTTPCFPMIGKIENFDPAKYDKSIVDILLYSLYAKIVMNIEVRPDQQIPGELPARFRIDGYQVFNVPTTVDFKGRKLEEDKNLTISDDVEVFNSNEVLFTNNNLAQGANKVTFSFYLPERFLQPVDSAAIYPYPFPKIDGKYRDEDLKYRQHFKPCLVEKNDPPATFVRFFGEFIDHQGHNYDVKYDIYVGSDEYNNFDVARNTQYNNYITIKGISNSLDQSGNIIALDHRVNVKRVNPIVINLRRETLLDSHFEVRPLRIRKNNSFMGEDLSKARVKVEVIYDDDDTEKNWIGLERSFGDGKTEEDYSTTYLVASELEDGRKNAAGKRKYFTTNLTTETLAGVGGFNQDGTSSKGGQKIIVPVADECIWIYVDECTQTGDDVRSATIRISFALDGQTYVPGQSIDYVINQRMLFPVTYTNGTPTTSDDYTYHIEYHEEYLYNYDAEDSYGQTKDEGMKWGLNGAQLSFDNRALFVDAGGINSVTNTVNEIVAAYSPFYDFYLLNDIEESKTKDRYHHAGNMFCKEIIKDLNDETRDTKTDEKINVLHLGKEPNSAIEYCFNRNKRNASGEVEDTLWYLPAIDEMEEIVMSQYGTNYDNYSYSRFPDFQAKFYWSSQPAYIHNFVHVDRVYRAVFWDTDGDRTGTYMIDNTHYARATSVEYKNESGDGATDPSNYHKKPSGMSGYSELLKIWWRENTFMQIEEGPIETFTSIQAQTTVDWSNNDGKKTTVLDPMSTEPGYLHRENDRARVRCVRKR